MGLRRKKLPGTSSTAAPKPAERPVLVGSLPAVAPTIEENGTVTTVTQGVTKTGGSFQQRLSRRSVKLPHHPAELVADASRMSTRQRQTLRRLSQPWQSRALTYYDLLPEVHFASGFYARGMSGLRLFVGYREDDGTITPSENAAANALLERIRDPQGGIDGLLYRYGELAFITGESLLLWRGAGDDSDETWEIVSTDELRTDGGNTYYRIKTPALAPQQLTAAPDDAFEPIAGDCIVYRLNTPHPRFSEWSDSPLRASLELCEELVLLTAVVRARIVSRMSGNGILTIPTELDPAQDAGGEDTDEDPAADGAAPGDEDPLSSPWEADFIETMVTPIEQPGTAAATVPIILRGPAEYLHPDFIRHITFKDVDEEYREIGLRKEAVERLAIGFDMPPEALTGVSGANHWNAWIIDEQTWKVHLKPVAIGFCGNLTQAYLQPTLRNEGEAEWDRYVVMCDPSSIVTNPDRFKDYEAMYKERVIGKKALREAGGATDADAPTKEDLYEMLVVAGVDPSVASGEAPVETETDTTGRDPSIGEDTTREEPDQDESMVAAGYPNDAIIAAASMAVLRCRELAGTRLLGRAQGRDDVDLATLRQMPKGQIAWTVGDRLGDLNDTNLTLVEDGGALFEQWLVDGGMDAKTATLLGDLVELHASRSLYQERPAALPAGFLAAVRR